MRLLVLSDLHVERHKFEPKHGLDFDAAILAGDIFEGSYDGGKVARWATQHFPERPIILVPGNHEFYNTQMLAELSSLKDQANGTNLHILSRDELVLQDSQGSVRFLGATLWTDFELPFSLAGEPPQSNAARSCEYAQEVMNDFKKIATTDGGSRSRWFTAADSLAHHHADRDWLRTRLAEPFSGRTVVVTHHAPCVRSIPDAHLPRFIASAFASDLPPAEFFGTAALWVHGHIHASADYDHFGTRVVCNPKGTLMKDGAHENLHFNPRLVVEV